jgi:hypothetical protein
LGGAACAPGLNARFVERMQAAIERGLERRPDGEAPERVA